MHMTSKIYFLAGLFFILGLEQSALAAKSENCRFRGTTDEVYEAEGGVGAATHFTFELPKADQNSNRACRASSSLASYCGKGCLGGFGYWHLRYCMPCCRRDGVFSQRYFLGRGVPYMVVALGSVSVVAFMPMMNPAMMGAPVVYSLMGTGCACSMVIPAAKGAWTANRCAERLDRRVASIAGSCWGAIKSVAVRCRNACRRQARVSDMRPVESVPSSAVSSQAPSLAGTRFPSTASTSAVALLPQGSEAFLVEDTCLGDAGSQKFDINDVEAQIRRTGLVVVPSEQVDAVIERLGGGDSAAEKEATGL